MTVTPAGQTRNSGQSLQDRLREIKSEEGWLTTAQLSGMQGWVEDNEKENGDDLT